MVDFITKLSPLPATNNGEWKPFVDGSSTHTSVGLGVAIVDPVDTITKLAIKLHFLATNNEAEYEALLAGLCLAKAMGVGNLSVFTNSQLLASEILGSFQPQDIVMQLYIAEATWALANFSLATVHKIPRADNALANTLAKLASAIPSAVGEPIFVEELHQQSITTRTSYTVKEDGFWMAFIV